MRRQHASRCQHIGWGGSVCKSARAINPVLVEKRVARLLVGLCACGGCHMTAAATGSSGATRPALVDALHAPALEDLAPPGRRGDASRLRPLGGQGLRRAVCSNHLSLVALAAARGDVSAQVERLDGRGWCGAVALCGCLHPLLEIESSRGESPLTRLVGRSLANGVTVMAGRCIGCLWPFAAAVVVPTLRPQGLRQAEKNCPCVVVC